MADDGFVVSPSTACFEQRFNCAICWAPNLRMIYGSCQHRFCETCLYDSKGKRRGGLERCPTCQRQQAFPATRPDVPEDNIEVQVQLGVRKCPNKGCGHQMWYWELQEHLTECIFVEKQETRRKSREPSLGCNMILRKRPLGSAGSSPSKKRSEICRKHNLRPRKGKTKTSI